jgi:hypothetical protein
MITIMLQNIMLLSQIMLKTSIPKTSILYCIVLAAVEGMGRWQGRQASGSGQAISQVSRDSQLVAKTTCRSSIQTGETGLCIMTDQGTTTCLMSSSIIAPSSRYGMIDTVAAGRCYHDSNSSQVGRQVKQVKAVEPSQSVLPKLSRRLREWVKEGVGMASVAEMVGMVVGRWLASKFLGWLSPSILALKEFLVPWRDRQKESLDSGMGEVVVAVIVHDQKEVLCVVETNRLVGYWKFLVRSLRVKIRWSCR